MKTLDPDPLKMPDPDSMMCWSQVKSTVTGVDKFLSVGGLRIRMNILMVVGPLLDRDRNFPKWIKPYLQYHTRYCIFLLILLYSFICRIFLLSRRFCAKWCAMVHQMSNKTSKMKAPDLVRRPGANLPYVSWNKWHSLTDTYKSPLLHLQKQCQISVKNVGKLIISISSETEHATNILIFL